MKKPCLIFLSLILMLSLAGCAGATPAPTADAPAQQSANPTAQPSAEQTATESEPVELMFWTMWDGGDVNIANAMFEEYNNTHPMRFTRFMGFQ